MIFTGQSLPTRREREAESVSTTVYTTIRSIVDRKNAEGIVPARATWQELRDVFDERHFEHLDFLIKRGVVKVTEALNYDTYEIDYPAYERMMAQQKRK